MVEKIKNEILQDRKNIFWFLTVSVIVMLGFYLYFVSHTVYTTVLRQQTEKSIAIIEGNMAELESEYLNAKNAVTIELARSKGFKNILATEYISRKPIGKSLSFNAGI